MSAYKRCKQCKKKYPVELFVKTLCPLCSKNMTLVSAVADFAEIFGRGE